MGLALALNAWGLSEAGYGNTYYAAAVRSMTMSWKNFFFGAFDPGGFVTVDKPPAFLWVGALSARVFGYSTLSILLPSAFAGAASVGLLWLIVRRWFGLAAATIAGLVLALSPISVAVNRLNMPEPFMILALVGAAGSVMMSLESRRWWAWTALAGFLVGVAFNTKMLGAWIPGPAFALAIVIAVPAITRVNLRQALARLAVLLAVTLMVSASWLLIVDAWPASDRPYVGGSTNNTELDLVLGYNGFSRVDGNSQGVPGGGNPGNFRPPSGGQLPGGGQLPNGGQVPDGGQIPDGRRLPNGGVGQPPGAPGANGGFTGAGGIVAGSPGLLRMFDDANAGQIAWLLPFALGAGVLCLWIYRRDPSRRAFAVLFLGWVLLFGGVFSYAEGIYHSYYTAAMVPGIAVLVGVGAVSVAGAVRRNPWWLAAAGGLLALTLFVQMDIAGRTPDYYGWLRVPAAMAVGGGVLAAVVLAARRKAALAGIAVALAGLLLIPGAWSLSEAANTPLNTTLPQAGPRQGASGQTFGSEAFDSSITQLAGWLKSHSDSQAQWQLVASNAMNASRLIAEEQLSVMALGGFSGSDPTITVSQFAGLVQSGQVRYVLIGGEAPGGFGAIGGPRRGALGRDGTQPQPAAPRAGVRSSSASASAGVGPVMSAVQSACTAVSDPGLPTAYQGQVYDCAGKADALRARAGGNP